MTDLCTGSIKRKTRKIQDGIQICTTDTLFLNEDINNRRTSQDNPYARSCTADR